jgi:hypothetical protein
MPPRPPSKNGRVCGKIFCLDFVRVDGDNRADRLGALSSGYADPDFDCPTCYQPHIKLGAPSRWRTSEDFMAGRLAATL